MKRIVIPTLALAGLAPLHAVTIAQYDMADLAIVSGQNSSTSSIVTVANVTAGGFNENLTGGTTQSEFGIGTVGATTGVNGYSARSLNSGPSNPWWEFTITPTGGATITLNSLTLDAGLVLGLTNTTSNWDYDVFTSIDSFASVVGTIDGPSLTSTSLTTTSNPATTSATGLSVSLASLAPQTSAFTIRIAPNRVLGTNGATTQRGGWIDNVTLDATVTIPEPTVALLGSIGLLGLLRRRRR